MWSFSFTFGTSHLHFQADVEVTCQELQCTSDEQHAQIHCQNLQLAPQSFPEVFVILSRELENSWYYLKTEQIFKLAASIAVLLHLKPNVTSPSLLQSWLWGQYIPSGWKEKKSGYLIFNMLNFWPLWKLENTVWASEELSVWSIWTDSKGFIVLLGLFIPGSLPRKWVDGTPSTGKRIKHGESEAEAFSGLIVKDWFGREHHASTPACKLGREIFQTACEFHYRPSTRATHGCGVVMACQTDGLWNTQPICLYHACFLFY